MPLRHHFRPPVSLRRSWEGFHGGWPMTMVQRLSQQLPEGYAAEPRVHLGRYFEIDVAGSEEGESDPGPAGDGGGVAVAPWAAPAPTATIDADFGELHEYEVLVYDLTDGDRRLVAAVELVSPANKDRPEHRRAFVAKCAALLQQRVCVAVVDVVTVRQFNLYADLLELAGGSDPAFGPEPPATYAGVCRARTAGRRPVLESWAYPLEVGRSLPTLPLWLADDLAVALDLDASYEDTCRALRTP